MMDLFVGTLSIYLDHDPTSRPRKKLYGQAGRYRQPNHGCEYRSMGNFWLSSPQLVEWVYDMVGFVVDFVEQKRYEEFWSIDVSALTNLDSWSLSGWNPTDCHTCHGYDVNNLRNAIANMDKAAGREFISLVESILPSELFSRFETLCNRDQNDLYKEWGFGIYIQHVQM